MTENQLCYECFEDKYGSSQSYEHLAELIERQVIVKCPNCKRKIYYGKEEY